MKDLLLRRGRLIDPAQGLDQVCDLRLRGGRVAELGEGLSQTEAEVIDCSDRVVAPGFVDLCCHLREPGFADIETIRSGARAALAGGFTAIAAMPDCEPAIDSESSVTYVRLKGEEADAARVYPIGALTKGRQGQDLSEMGGMTRAGAIGFSDEDSALERPDIFVKALRYAHMLERRVLTRCEDRWLRGKGVAHPGLLAELLGLPAIAPGTEEVMLGRYLHLARLEGAPLHLLHLSTEESMHLVGAAKREGVPITCSVTPHHLLLSEECIRGYDPVYKFTPPLRSEGDRRALIEALSNGTVDAISSAHTPRGENEKAVEFVFAASGSGAIEATFPVLYSRLVISGEVTLTQLIGLLSLAPARILGVEGGRLAVGDRADVTILDLEEEWRLEPKQFLSNCRSTPFAQWAVQGAVTQTIVEGRVRYRRGEVGQRC